MKYANMICSELICSININEFDIFQDSDNFWQSFQSSLQAVDLVMNDTQKYQLSKDCKDVSVL